jgi:hypothetical protein
MVPSDQDVTLSMLDISCDLYYTPMMIVNDDPRVINKLEASLLTMLESSFTIVKCL